MRLKRGDAPFIRGRPVSRQFHLADSISTVRIERTVIDVKFTINEITLQCLFVSVTDCFVPVFVPCLVSLFCSGNTIINYMERTRVNVRPTYIANSFISQPSCVAVCCPVKYSAT